MHIGGVNIFVEVLRESESESESERRVLLKKSQGSPLSNTQIHTEDLVRRKPFQWRKVSAPSPLSKSRTKLTSSPRNTIWPLTRILNNVSRMLKKVKRGMRSGLYRL